MRRVKWGVGAAVVVGAAWLISNFFDLAGPGGGTQFGLLPNGSNEIAAPRDDAAPEEPDLSAVRTDVSTTSPVSTQTPKSAVGPGEVVQVLVDGREFFLGRGGNPLEWVPTDESTIAAVVKKATGDDAGIKVRVNRRPSARASAEDRLSAVLHEAGLTEAEIDRPERLAAQPRG